MIKGKVLGTDGEPIIGASVLVKGSTTGVVTDLDGNYTLANVSKGAILEFSYVGYVKLTKTVGNETTINAILYEDSQMLEGVEVVAFGTQKKRECYWCYFNCESSRTENAIQQSNECTCRAYCRSNFLSKNR